MSKKLLVVLIRGPIVFKEKAINNEATPAIALAYLSSYLKKRDYKVKIIDAIGEGLNQTWELEKYSGFKCQGLTFNEIISRIPKNTNIIGFSGMFSGEWPVLRDLILEVRKSFPKVLITAGGEHITALTEYSLKDCPALDVCVRGEGEEIFYQLLESFRKTGSYKEVSGIGFLNKKGKYKQKTNETLRIQNINNIPWPDWPKGYLEKFWAKEKSFGVATKRDMPFMFSRGCPYQCTFCSNPLMGGSKYILRDINDVIKEIKYYLKKYKITSIQLYDLTAILSKKWIIEFCQRIKKEKIKLNWSLPSGTRSEALDKETLSLLKKIGCNYLVYAPESGSKKTLAMVKKRISLEKITKSIEEAKKQKLVIRTNLIIGFPGEKWGDIFKTVFYGLKLAIKGVDEVPLFIFSPYPGTEIFYSLYNKKKIRLNDKYFFSLTSLNSDYLSWNVVSFNPNLDPKILGLIRTTTILVNYALGYVLYPHRIIRTIRNLRSYGKAATVFEHRLKNLIKREYEKND